MVMYYMRETERLRYCWDLAQEQQDNCKTVSILRAPFGRSMEHAETMRQMITQRRCIVHPDSHLITTLERRSNAGGLSRAHRI